MICFAVMLSLQDREDVVLADDEALFSVDGHFGPVVLAEQDAIADLQVWLAHGPVLLSLPVADGQHLALRGPFLGGIRDDDSSAALFFFLDAPNDDAILKWANL